MGETNHDAIGTEIAIVGMAGRFPGARNLDEFWRNLESGMESLSTFTDQELAAAGVPEEIRRDSRYVPRRGVLDGADLFDAAFFGYYPREAQILDPQQRVFLECAWEALEHAGHDPGSGTARVGVFAGASANEYASALNASPEVRAAVDPFQIGLATSRDFLSTRVSYKLGLEGPSLTVQTGCSTSLVAVHLACQSLLTGDCDIALAGGVSISVPQRAGYLPVEGGVLSPDGRCRAFDARGRGTVSGDGVGIVVMKRLEDALTERDTIHAVIKGSAINNDGRDKIGFTAPSVKGQAAAIRAAHLVADVKPETIGYVEAHGTGTPLGDPIEVAALIEAFGDAGTRCGLGSVKTNIGHLDAAAGVAGLIKTVLALQHRRLPPTLHFTELNPEIDLGGSPFHVNAELRAWEQDGPRRAGVSSFGIGGTNAHVVLEEAPPPAETGPSHGHHLLVLSARTEPALRQARADLAEHLSRSGHDLADVAHTLRLGRRAFAHRTAVVCADIAGAVAALAGAATGREAAGNRPVVFMFPGGGAQRPEMAADLYAHEPVFREAVDECARLLTPHLGADLRSILYGTARGDGVHRVSTFPAALFAVEYALARLWNHWGIRPQAVIGHSLGEYTAACLAGVFSLEDALALIALRGRLFDRIPPGAMLSVALPERDLRPLLGPPIGSGLAVAAVNGPRSCVISGDVAAVETLERRLTGQGVTCRRLQVAIAAHSAAVEPILTEFGEFVRSRRLNAPRLPIVSNLTGTWLTPEQATDPGYWTAHLRHTVRFSDGVRTLLEDPSRVFLEVGPGWALSSLVRAHDTADEAPLTAASLRSGPESTEDTAAVLEALGTLWSSGVDVDWAAFQGRSRTKVPLPTYPFQRRRYWPDGYQEEAPQPVEDAAPAPVGEVADRLLTLWRALFGNPSLRDGDDFFQLGGDSLLATRMLSMVNREFGAGLVIKDLLSASTVARLARVIDPSAASGHSELPQQDTRTGFGTRPDRGMWLDEDARLDPAIVPPAGPDAGPDAAHGQCGAVLLTGATGYLGAHLLGALLEGTDHRVHCLVRASTEAEAGRRLRRVMREHGIADSERVIPVPGDLERPLLGLSEDAFDRLGAEVDAIYHCGAVVHFTLPYAALRDCNVLGTQEVLRLAVRHRLKPVHHVSTTAVFSADRDGEIGEDAVQTSGEVLPTGYAQSKWVAERLAEAARERGIPVAVYRPGAVTGDTRTSASRPDDAIWRMLKGCLQLGLAPDIGTGIVGAPADYVSRAIVHLARTPSPSGTFHLIGTRATPWREVFGTVRDLGYRLETVDYLDWLSRLDDLREEDGNALFPLVHQFARTQEPASAPFTCRATSAALSGSGVECPPLDAELLRTYIRHFVDTGFLPPPERGFRQLARLTQVGGTHA
ncbi:thioester reductase domain-containing protein [Planotetraspora sp. A-T 1434]|uniref:type I polyketide synthase n=1 Tax=Planotetraspora sp. A-T 1434 TaxID=2979219 RepID=UPI0021BE6460|nr:thioester reductase domain-containing protein [Planotetraspora sp. A-T 1434]MCT9933569.1 thioester reductase domain-containing protein [Planotetraspora sp. A-T 1434]